MTTIRIPDLMDKVNQFRTAIHPDYKGVSQDAEEWFESYKIMSPTRMKAFFNFTKPGLQGAMVYPLSDKKYIRLAIDHFILLFSFDDPFDEDALRLDMGSATKLTNTVISAITDTEDFQPIPKYPVITAYHDLFVRLRAVSTASAYKRFEYETVEAILSVNKQVEMRARGLFPNIKEYMLHRRESSGMKPSITMLEITRPTDVPDNVVEHPTIKALRDIANDIVWFANDILSFNKEQSKGDYFNLVSIVSIEKKIPVQSAIEYVFVMFESAIHRWFGLRAQIPTFDPHTDEIVSQFVEGLEYLISGFVHWHWEVERYLGPEELRVEVKNTLIRLYPLELGSRQMPPDIRYGYSVNIEP